MHHFFNPKAGLFYRINNNLDAFASFAIANREPNRDDYTEAGISQRPKAERLFDYEAGSTFKS